MSKFNHRIVEYEGQEYPIPDEGLVCHVRDSEERKWTLSVVNILCRTEREGYVDYGGISWKQAKPVHLKRKELSPETCPDDTRIFHKNWEEGERITCNVRDDGFYFSNGHLTWKKLNDPETPWRWWYNKKPTCEVE